jgi:hypothetical protein
MLGLVKQTGTWRGCFAAMFLALGVNPCFCQKNSTNDFTNIASLVASGLPGPTASEVSVAGYERPGDGGGGAFRAIQSTAQTNLGTIFASRVEGWRWERISPGYLSPRMFGAKGDQTNDDTAAVQLALTLAGREIVRLDPGVYKITKPLWITNSNTRLEATGAVILARGDFRALTVSHVSNVSIRGFSVNGVTNASAQAGLRFDHATNCDYSGCTFQHIGLNGIELASSDGIRGTNNRVYWPGKFAIFYYDTINSSDTDSYEYKSGLFSHEFKSSKHCYSTRTKIIDPGDYGAFFWTGLGTEPEAPGVRLTEDCGFYDLYIQGGPRSKHLIYINASRDCFVRGAHLELDPASTFAAVAVNGTFFYNEGNPMTADLTSGSTNALNVVNAMQLKAGDRIHFSGSKTNHTIYAVSGNRVALLGPVNITGRSVVLGFVARPDNATLENVTVVGNGSDALVELHNFILGNTEGDPLAGLRLKNVVSESASDYGMNIVHATVHVEGGSFRNSAGLREWNLGPGAKVTASHVLFQSSTNMVSYGVVLNGGAEFSSLDCEYRDLAIGIAPQSNKDKVSVEKCAFNNISRMPLAVIDNSVVKNCVFTNNLVSLGSYNAAIRVYGTNNILAGNKFSRGTSHWMANYIAEQPGASGNVFSNNVFNGSLAKNIRIAAGSKSAMKGDEKALENTHSNQTQPR